MSGGNRRSEPNNWVTGVAFTKHPVYSSAVAAELQKKLHTPTAATAAWSKVGAESLASPCPAVQIRPVTQEGHPANGQCGLFATKHLAAGSFILPYIGFIHTNATEDTNAESDYDLSMDRELGVSVDAGGMGNEARFVNDYRGIADSPNAEFQDCWVQILPSEGQSRNQWERRIGIFVLGPGKAGKRSRGISPGQEILINYGRSFWTERKAQGKGHVM
ncbi:hypothetical protein KVT40_008744 [Elsinoe batatas]|uniref:SET domain-containing protein n=1 Tax=Elsinoe batatas TaxID=2601811 RepID=A0A8K0L0W8_9PEZI|nr:hypothetical protein KVT40_008744 [Elsinoe batatas]